MLERPIVDAERKLLRWNLGVVSLEGLRCAVMQKADLCLWFCSDTWTCAPSDPLRIKDFWVGAVPYLDKLSDKEEIDAVNELFAALSLLVCAK